MGFEKGQKGRQQVPLAGPGAKLVRIQSRKLEEPPRAPFVSQRRGQRSKCQRFRVDGFIVCPVA